jgi:glutaredoxin 3
MTAHDHQPTAILYTRRWCGYCWSARRLLKRLAIEFKEIPLDGRPELRRRVSARAGNWPTVPMIFIGDRFIGGYTETAALHRRGELLPLVNAAEA